MLDSKQLPDWGPFQVEARLHPDYDSSPDDADCYTAKQKEAFENDEWSYVGLEVVVSLDDHELGSDSLWGIEHGWIPLTDENDNLTENPVQHYSVLDDASTGSLLDDVTNEACQDAVRFIQRLRDVAVPA